LRFFMADVDAVGAQTRYQVLLAGRLLRLAGAALRRAQTELGAGAAEIVVILNIAERQRCRADVQIAAFADDGATGERGVAGNISVESVLGEQPALLFHPRSITNGSRSTDTAADGRCSQSQAAVGAF